MTLRQLIRSDLDRFTQTFALRAQPYSRTRVIFESFVFKAGFQAVVLYRLGHWLHQRGWTYPAWFLARLNIALTGADIEFNAVIGPGLFISHPVGIVIGRGTRIGTGATIFQGVTCGARSWHPAEIGKFPAIGDNCCLFAYAQIVGDVRIGDECVIAAQAVVTRDVPDGALARGVPAVVVPDKGREMLRSWEPTPAGRG
jgi:serine O-acetyltransferase